MWKEALGTDDHRIVDIRVNDNPGEIAKYVSKPGAYLSIDGDEWRCDSQTLETLHYGLAHRRMVHWSRSLSKIRKALGFLDSDEGAEDLVDVGEDDDGEVWVPVRILTYKWCRDANGRWGPTGARPFTGRSSSTPTMTLTGVSRFTLEAVEDVQQRSFTR
jgi:hypothetical protein